MASSGHSKCILCAGVRFLHTEPGCVPYFPTVLLANHSPFFSLYQWFPIFYSKKNYPIESEHTHTHTRRKGAATVAAEVVSLKPACLSSSPPHPPKCKHSYLQAPGLTKADLRDPAVKLLEAHMVCYLLCKKEIRKVYTLFLQKEAGGKYTRNH